MKKLLVRHTDSEDLEWVLQDIQRDEEYEIVNVLPNIYTAHSGDLECIVTNYVVLYREVEKNPYDKVKVV